ncbi:hypothetical protein, partial [Anaerolinea thermolimosa]|uniref:hypothetical protein n=1 Tax=Anaerolinea thermolimosa TaxID=229919 RepID=UPI001F22728B
IEMSPEMQNRDVPYEDTSGIVSPLFIGDISILHFRGHFYFALTGKPCKNISHAGTSGKEQRLIFN